MRERRREGGRERLIWRGREGGKNKDRERMMEREREGEIDRYGEIVCG